MPEGIRPSLGYLPQVGESIQRRVGTTVHTLLAVRISPTLHPPLLVPAYLKGKIKPATLAHSCPVQSNAHPTSPPNSLKSFEGFESKLLYSTVVPKAFAKPLPKYPSQEHSA